MDIGTPQRELIIEPIEEPRRIQEPETQPVAVPATPVKQPEKAPVPA